MRISSYLLLLLLPFLLTGCDLIGGIFEAGFYGGIIVVLLVLAILGYIVYKIFKR